MAYKTVEQKKKLHIATGFNQSMGHDSKWCNLSLGALQAIRKIILSEIGEYDIRNIKK